MIFQEERERWFAFVPAMFEAVKYLRGRELMFLKGISIRWCQAASYNYLSKVINTFDINKKNCCAYASLDQYEHIPQFTANLKKRKIETDAWATSQKKIVGVDFGIDIDYKNGTWKDAIPEVVKLTTFLDTTKVKYAVWCSLGHGFHIVIPYEEIKIAVPDITPEEARIFYEEVAKKLTKIAPSIDFSAYMETRVFKAPYMLNENNEVVLPLLSSEIYSLRGVDKDYFKADNIRNKYLFKNRGVFMNGLTGNFEKFVEEVDKL